MTIESTESDESRILELKPASGRKCVLIAEDNPILVLILTKVIQKMTADEVEVVVAQNGKEAAEFAAANIPDVVVLDWMMPDYDGGYFLERQLKTPSIREIPVIIHSALGEDVLEIDRRRYPAVTARLKKPTLPEILVSTIRPFVQ